MDKCQVCHKEISTRICNKCGKLICDRCYVSKLDVCIECGAKVLNS